MSTLYTVLLLGISSLFTSDSNVVIRTYSVKTKVQVSLIKRQYFDQNWCEEEDVLTHSPMLIDLCDGFKCENNSTRATVACIFWGRRSSYSRGLFSQSARKE